MHKVYFVYIFSLPKCVCNCVCENPMNQFRRSLENRSKKEVNRKDREDKKNVCKIIEKKKERPK